jgi:hypothetical protein
MFSSLRWSGLDLFMGVMKYSRVCWVKGNMGTSKLSVSFALALECLADPELSANRLISTVSSRFSSPPSHLGLFRSVVVADSSLTLRLSVPSFRRAVAYARQMECFYFFASHYVPDPNACLLSIQREWDFSVFGIPLWVYKIYCGNGGDDDLGNLYFFNPSRFSFSDLPLAFSASDVSGLIESV